MSTNGNLLMLGVVVGLKGRDIGGKYGQLAERVLPVAVTAMDEDDDLEGTLGRVLGAAGLAVRSLDKPDGCFVVGEALSQIEWGIGQAASNKGIDELAAVAARVSAALSACGIAHVPADIRVRSVAVEG